MFLFLALKVDATPYRECACDVVRGIYQGDLSSYFKWLPTSIQAPRGLSALQPDVDTVFPRGHNLRGLIKSLPTFTTRVLAELLDLVRHHKEN